MLNVTVILCTDPKGVVSNHGEMPWIIPSEREYVHAWVKDKHVVMGRGAFEQHIRDYGVPPKCKRLFVLSRNPHYALQYPASWLVTSVQSYTDLKDSLRDDDYDIHLAVLGGYELFSRALTDLATTSVILTTTHQAFVGDKRLPISATVHFLESSGFVLIDSLSDESDPYTRNRYQRLDR